MSKLTDRSKKDIFYPSTGLENDRNNKPVKTLTGENTSKIKKDKAGKDYSLVRQTTENFIKGDTIRPGNLPRVNDFIQGGDYKVKETPESTTRATDEPRTFSPVRLENDYSSMKSMGQAVARWTSPHKLTGKASPMEEEGLSKSYYTKKSKKEQDKESVEKYGVAGSSKKTKKAKKSIAKDEAKAKKKEYKESDEGKEATAKKREKATDITQAIGRAMAAAGGTTVNTPSKTASQKGQEQRDKEKKDKEKAKVDSSAEDLKKGVVGEKT
jgi:hypothetical protein